MTRYDSICKTSDFYQYLNQLQLNLSTYLFKFRYELDHIMTRYDFLEDMSVFRTMFELTTISPMRVYTFGLVCELVQLMTK